MASFKGNGTARKAKQKKEFISRKKIAQMLDIPEEDVTELMVIRALQFAATFDRLVAELFAEEWVVEYARLGESMMVAIPYHGLSAATIQTELYAAEVIKTEDGTLMENPDGVMFNRGFAAAFSSLIKFFTGTSPIPGGEES